MPGSAVFTVRSLRSLMRPPLPEGSAMCSRHGCAWSLTPVTGGDSSASPTGPAGVRRNPSAGLGPAEKRGRSIVTRPTPEGYRSGVPSVRGAESTDRPGASHFWDSGRRTGCRGSGVWARTRNRGTKTLRDAYFTTPDCKADINAALAPPNDSGCPRLWRPRIDRGPVRFHPRGPTPSTQGLCHEKTVLRPGNPCVTNATGST
jgi:hypothetical protein